jgi:hypothetical protein
VELGLVRPAPGGLIMLAADPDALVARLHAAAPPRAEPLV